MTVGFDENGQLLSLIDIRPMDLGDILDGTIRVYRKRPWVFVAILAIIVSIPMFVTQVATTYMQNLLLEIIKSIQISGNTDLSGVIRSREYINASAAMLASGIFLFFLAPIAQAAMVYTVSETILGRDIDVARSLNHIKPVSGVIIFAYLLYLFIALGVFAVVLGIMALITMAVGVQNTAAVVSIAMFLLLIYSLFITFLTIKYMFIPQSVVLDNTGASGGLKRSYGLSTGYWWRTFGIYLVISLIVGIISGLLGRGVQLIEFGINNIPGVTSAVGLALGGVIMTCITLFLNPVTFIASTLMYYDLRIRKEGFDLVLLSESIAGGSGESRENNRS
ncbi:MAG: hypothetical protein NTY09_10670 [bacterium]|nr:hypothetical protein [bacterium]